MSQIETANQILSLQLELQNADQSNFVTITSLTSKLIALSAKLATDIIDGKCDFILKDEETDEEKHVTANVSSYGLYLGVDGYTDSSSIDGGEIILLDWFNSKLSCRIWGDINADEPTHNIDLSEAKLSARIEA